MSNNFFDFTRSFTDSERMFDYIKRFHNVDFSSFSDLIRRNSEALTSANRVAAENMQSIVRRCAEIYQSNASRMFDTIREVVSSSDLEQAGARHQTYLRSFLDDTVNNTREIMDMVSRSSMEVFEILRRDASDDVANRADDNRNRRDRSRDRRDSRRDGRSDEGKQ